MAYGVIYIAYNARDGKDTYKVGKTERNVQQRMRELTSATAVLGSYEAIATFVVFDIHAAEQACHKALQNHRLQDNREFFELPLERLLRIVQQSVSPFAARDIIPSITHDVESSGLILSPNTTSAAEADAVETFEAIETMIDWTERLEVSISKIEDTFESEEMIWNAMFDVAYERARDLLAFTDGGKDWGKPNGKNFYRLPTPQIELITVLFCAPQKKEPLELWVTAKASDLPLGDSPNRALFYGELIVEPYSLQNTDARENTVRWKMLDDGRFGRVTISVRVDKNLFTHGRRKNIKPTAIIRITTEELKYNDSLEIFEGIRSDEDFVDLDNATAKFEATIAKNYRHSMNDIRQVTGEHYDKFGNRCLRISDGGVFSFPFSQRG